MERLPKWSFSDKFPAFLDTESMSAIEMVGRLYDAIQTLIDEYNTFEEKSTNIINSFINGEKESFDVFAVSLRQEFNDFINVIALKVAGQDNKLNELVDYIRSNTEHYINDVITELKNSGQLDASILNALNNIENKQVEHEAKITLKVEEFVEQINANFENIVSDLSASLAEYQNETNNNMLRVDNNFLTLSQIVEGMRIKMLGTSGYLRDVLKKFRSIDKHNQCRISSVAESHIVVTTGEGSTQRNVRLVTDKDLNTAFEISRLMGYGFPRDLLYSSTNAGKELLNFVVDGVLYENDGSENPLAIICTQDFVFDNLLINYRLKRSDGTYLYTTLGINNEGFTVVETKDSASELSVGRGLINSGNYVKPICEHKNCIVFGIGGNNKYIFTQQNYIDTDSVTKRIKFKGGF